MRNASPNNITHPAIKFALVFAVIVIGLLVVIALPDFVKARVSHLDSACRPNLKQIEGVKATWAMENKQPPTAIPTDADIFGPNAYIGMKPVCPLGGTYRLGAVNELPTCSQGATTPGHSLDPDR